MYSGNVSPCIEINLTRDFKGEKTPLHVIIYKTYYAVTVIEPAAVPIADELVIVEAVLFSWFM